jgi:uncharacterized protein YndB with AHSA1/START domain
LRKEDPVEVRRELVLPALRDDVWEALTDPERLEEWFANEVELDLETGEALFRWENGEVRRAVVEEAELERRLAMRWWDPYGDDSNEGEVVVFTLEDVPEGTRLVVTETATGPQACAGEWSWALEMHVGRRRLLCAV